MGCSDTTEGGRLLGGKEHVKVSSMSGKIGISRE